MNKEHYAYLSMLDSIWEEELTPEELAELKSNHHKSSIKKVKQPRLYRTNDGVHVTLKSFRLVDLFECGIANSNLEKAYDAALSAIPARVKEMGFKAQVVTLPYSLDLVDHFPNRLQIIELSRSVKGGEDRDSLVIARVTDTFDGVIEKEIHDIVASLQWSNLTSVKGERM